MNEREADDSTVHCRGARIVVAGLAALALLASCHVASSPTSARAQVDSALAAYDTLIVHMDPDGIAAAFTPDGESVDGDQAPIRGPSAIREHLMQFANFHVLANRLEADSTRVRADTAWQVGSYWQRVQLPAGDTVEVSGRFAVTWRQVSPGHWRIERMRTFRPPA